jgi:hypothetical protein
MTREERAALKAQRLKNKLATDRQELAQAEAVYRDEQRASRNKRRYRMGTLADEAGLAIWDEPTLQALFEVLARLRELPDPVAVLDALFSDPVMATITAAAASYSLGASPNGSDASAVSRNGEGSFLS